MTNVQQIVDGLDGRRTRTGGIARCPAHHDRRPSLSICERDGRVLVHCHAGCSQTDVIAALRDRGLWPEPHTPSAWRSYVHDPDWRGDCERAYYWALAAELLAEATLEALPETHPDRYPLTQLLLAIRRAEDSDHLKVALYRSWRARTPRITAGLVYAGRLSQARMEDRLAQSIAYDEL
jgi:hypothetical protein